MFIVNDTIMKQNYIYAAAAVALLLTSCNNDDYTYDPERATEYKMEQFAAAFTQKFGKIAPDQEWDFSGSPRTILTTSTRAASQSCTPDLAYPYLDADGYYDIPAVMQTDLNKIKENTDNSKLGNSYAMSIPDNNFSIIPIRQGYTSSPFELHMVVGSGDDAIDYTLWKKGEMMQIRKAGSTEKWRNIPGSENVTYGNYDVRARVLTFKNMPAGEPMYFYTYRSSTQTYPSSLDGYTKDFTSIVTVPEQLINDGKKVKVIGVEAQMIDTDRDYEDVMFMIVGDPTLPQEITKEEGMSFKQTFQKRYMIEDLGSMDDFDFNDIVVDMQSTREIKFTYDSATGAIKDKTYTPWTDQTATIRHLGGTLGFRLQIGDTDLGWMPGRLGADPNTEYDVEGWDPVANNISIQVKLKADGEESTSILFPKAGSAPIIIATPVEQEWMPERQSIIESLKDMVLKNKED